MEHEYVTCDELFYWRAYSVFTAAVGLRHTFSKFLGEAPLHYRNELPPFYTMSKEAAKRCELLLGPYGAAIAKIWAIQQLR